VHAERAEVAVDDPRILAEQLAHHVGAGLGGLLNATFGNAAELIIAGFALHAGLHDVVKASITGSIIGNVLLVFGLALRGLVPAGYMPARADDGETLRFTVCQGISGTDAFPPGTRHVDVVVHPPDDRATAESRCPFGLMGGGVVTQVVAPGRPWIGRDGAPRPLRLSESLPLQGAARAHRPRGPPPVLV